MEETEKRPTFVGRICKKEVDKNRPIKIALKIENDKKAIFKKLRMLKGNTDFTGVAVAEDFTKSEKKVLKTWSYDEFLGSAHPSYEETSSKCHILNALGITKNDYYWALSIYQDTDFVIHILRPPNSCFVKNYFTIRLQAWEANVFNYSLREMLLNTHEKKKSVFA